MNNYAQWMADSIMARKINLTDHWGYEYGLTLDGIAKVWQQTGEQKYFDFIAATMDHFIQTDGRIAGYNRAEYNLDHLNNGKILLTLYQATGKEKYKVALNTLRKQIETHPRTREGAFWHKKIYPHQIWLDGLYMGAAFYALYIKEFGHPAEFDDVANQFFICEKNLKDEKNGLFYHAWDEAKQQIWADKATGLSSHFWLRGMGWYVMALVDTLDVFPVEHPARERLVEQFLHCMKALLRVQDQRSHVWYQIVDQGKRRGNYLEASGSSMIVYALLKGIRRSYLPDSFIEEACATYQGLIDEFILETRAGLINLNKVCYVAGLGGVDKRDGTFAYYISEPIVSNEPKGLGPFMLAAAERQLLWSNTK